MNFVGKLLKAQINCIHKLKWNAINGNLVVSFGIKRLQAEIALFQDSFGIN